MLMPAATSQSGIKTMAALASPSAGVGPPIQRPIKRHRASRTRPPAMTLIVCIEDPVDAVGDSPAARTDGAVLHVGELAGARREAQSRVEPGCIPGEQRDTSKTLELGVPQHRLRQPAADYVSTIRLGDN